MYVCMYVYIYIYIYIYVYTWLISDWAHFYLGSFLIGLDSNRTPS